MPKLEPTAIQRELDQGLIWPFYWIYGTEKFKSRELLGRIRTAVLGTSSSRRGVSSWGESSFDAGETLVETLLDAVSSPPLGGGVQFVLVRDAHLLKNPELLSELFGSPRKLSELDCVCVCISKDLDGRKKFSKVLTDQAAVVPCEEVPESQREGWIQHLAKRRDLELDAPLILKLCTLDPWSLDRIEQELEKFVTSKGLVEVILEGALLAGGDVFLESFFSRDLKAALVQVPSFANHPDESLPLLGLLGWNLRQLVVFISDQENGTRHSKLSSHWLDRFRKWSHRWQLMEVIELQKDLAEMDFKLKQTPLLPLGLWSDLVIRFCR